MPSALREAVADDFEENASSQGDGPVGEEAPLLAPRIDSRTLPNAPNAPDAPDAPDRSVGPLRAFVIILSTWIFIFLQGKARSVLFCSRRPFADG